ncbi:hypothetical protein DNTS_016099, partial [Danionella cerebrum]
KPQGVPRRGRRGICAFFRRARKLFRRSGEPAPSAPQAEPEPVPGPSGLQSSVKAVEADSEHSDTAVPHHEASREVPRRGRRGFCAFCKRARKFFRRSREPAPSQAEPEPVPGPSGLPPSKSIEEAGSEQASESAAVSDYEASRGNLKAIYAFQERLAEGSFGVVYKATRGSDWLEVAIKRVSSPGKDYIVVPDHTVPLYREVALMVKLRRSPVCPYVMEMFEWFDTGDSLYMVMEFPQQFVSLKEFIHEDQGFLAYFHCRPIMRQLVQAVQHCISRGIFHNNINLQNILVNDVDRVPMIKLIGFDSARLVDEDGFDSRTYDGAPQFQPPEALGRLKYHAVPTNVWFLGIILLVLKTSELPFRSVKDVFIGTIRGLAGVLSHCLRRRPEERPTLEELSQHRWITWQVKGHWSRSTVANGQHGALGFTERSLRVVMSFSGFLLCSKDMDWRARKLFRRSGEPAPSAPQAEPEPVPGPSGLQSSVKAVEADSEHSDTAVPHHEASRDEAGEESVLSSGEHKGFSGDQESLLLFLLPLLLKQNPSRSPDHLGSRVQRMQWQPVQNVQTLQSRMMELAEEFPDEAGEGSVLSSGEHKGFSGDQESLLLFLLPLLLKQNLSRSQDHLGSRGQRIQGQPVLNGLLPSQMTTERLKWFPDEARDKSLHSSGEKLEHFGDQENQKLSQSQGHLDSKVQRTQRRLAQLQTLQSLIMSLAEVAVKSVSNPPADSYIFVPDHPKPLYGEVALLVMLRRPPVCPYVIKMLDWFDMGGSLSIVMEYPESCMSLKEFIRKKIGLPISNGYIIMRQLIKAVQFCLHRRVFHNDINLQNILVYVKPVPKIKLIGFNSARLLDEDGYDASTYNGDPRYMPPEVFAMRRYHAVPTSVWFMGIIYYAILKGQLPFHSIKEIFFGPIQYLPSMSSRCEYLLKMCLRPRADMRPTLEELLEH